MPDRLFYTTGKNNVQQMTNGLIEIWIKFQEKMIREFYKLIQLN